MKLLFWNLLNGSKHFYEITKQSYVLWKWCQRKLKYINKSSSNISNIDLILEVLSTWFQIYKKNSKTDIHFKIYQSFKIYEWNKMHVSYVGRENHAYAGPASPFQLSLSWQSCMACMYLIRCVSVCQSYLDSIKGVIYTLTERMNLEETRRMADGVLIPTATD